MHKCHSQYPQKFGCNRMELHHTKLLNSQIMFPTRWIGRRGYKELRLRAPNINPLDYFLWSYLKTTVYKPEPANTQIIYRWDKKNGASRCAANAKRSFIDRIACCLVVAGQNFVPLCSINTCKYCVKNQIFTIRAILIHYLRFEEQN